MSEREIFQSAVDITDAVERRAFLDEACGDDRALREQVEQLLRSHDDASRFLETPAAQQLAPDTADEPDATTVLPKPWQAFPASSANLADEATALDFLEPSTKPDSLGRLAHYEVVEVLGRGAFGIVLKAFDEKLHRMVAIKVMNPELAATSPPRKRFQREAQSAAKVRHENIVAIHAVEEQPLPYLVMEYIPGGTLQQRLDQHGPLDLEEILRIGQQVALGLAAAHAQGLLHRDIKPANILLESGVEERAKITDFGLARATDDASLTQSGLIAGTPMFMAPEQAKGQPLDHRADLFSLGSVLYTMASGRPPFRAPNTIAVLKRLCEDTPRPITEIIPETPPWLCDIIAKLQAKDPDDRFQSAKDVAQVLGEGLAHVKDPARTPQPVAPVLSASNTATKVMPRRDAGRSRSSNMVLTIIIGFCLVPVLGCLAVMVALAIPAYQAAQFRKMVSLQGTGTLIVQSDEPFITALVDDQRHPLPGREAIELEMPAGPHTVAFFQEGQLRQTQQVDVQAGQTHVVQLSTKAPTVLYDTAVDMAAWQPLFNGRDLTGWEPNPHWAIENGCLVSRVLPSASRTPPLLTTVRNNFQNFHARVEAKINSGGDSGLFFRFGEEGNKALQAQISPAPSGMGSLLRETTTLIPSTITVGPETWFTLEVIAQGPRITVVVNGTEVVRWLDPSGDVPRGPLAFESGFPGTELMIRKVEVKSPPSDSPGTDLAWQPLFNGRDLTGWQTHPQQPGHWRVEEGAIVGSGEVSHLFTQRADLHDFEFRGEVRLNPQGNSGVFIRTPFIMPDASAAMASPPGYEVQLVAGNQIHPQQQYLSGGLIPLANTSGANIIQPTRWYKFRVIALGNKFETWIDDVQTVSAIDPLRKYQGGHLALQVWSAESRVEFRNLEVRRFSSSGNRPEEEQSIWSADAPPPALAPFDSTQATTHQEAWAHYLGVPVEFTDTLGSQFRLIPPGEFRMGGSEEEIQQLARELEQAGANEFDLFVARMSGPQHQVTLTQPFYLGVHELTVGQYRAFIEASRHIPTMEQLKVNRFKWQDAAVEPNSAQRAVIGISWDDAQAYCLWASKQRGLEYGLPTEAQWEFACRAGTTTLWSFGDEVAELPDYAVFGRETFWPAEVVGSKKPNPFGLYDMHGNADEWCLDWHDSDIYKKGPSRNPVILTNPTNKNSGRVARGGTAQSAPWWTRSATRPWDFPASPNNPKGVRLALSVDSVRKTLSQRPPLAKHQFPSDKWFDAIPLIDPQLDKWDLPERTGQNEWRIENGELAVTRDVLASKLLLPLDSNWTAFECELEFTRREGEGGLNINIPTAAGECPVVFSAPNVYGLHLGAPTTGKVLQPELKLTTGQRTTVRVVVRRQNERDHVAVEVNGEAVGEWDGDRTAIAYTHFEGYPSDRRMSLWIQRGGNDIVFHRIRIRPLDGTTAETLRPVSKDIIAAAAPAEWETLFNGTDLTGWKTHADEPGGWRVEDGALVGSESPAYLFSERDDFTDFHLRAEVQINDGGDGGVMLRCPFTKPGKEGLPGYEAQIQAGKPLVDGWNSGAIGGSFPMTGWRLLVPSSVLSHPDERFVLEVIAKGNEMETRINGEKTAWSIDPDRTFTRGHIALQHSGEMTTVKFYKLEIRPLSP